MPQLAAETEAAKSRVDVELLATAKMASAMEARLRESQAAADAARSAAAAADRRAYEVGGRRHCVFKKCIIALHCYRHHCVPFVAHCMVHDAVAWCLL